MFSLKEFIFILLASAVVGYVIGFPLTSYISWFQFSLLGLSILLINILAKKLAAFKLGCEVEIKPWTVRRYWFRRTDYFGFGLPAWLIWPILVVWLSLGRVWWLTLTGFEVFATRKRAGRKFAELTEWNMALIAASGIAANLLAAIISFSLGYNLFTVVNLWFVFFNMLPFPAYDGGRILFGERLFWVFMFASSLIILVLLHITKSSLIISLASLVLVVIAIVIIHGLREGV